MHVYVHVYVLMYACVYVVWGGEGQRINKLMQSAPSFNQIELHQTLRQVPSLLSHLPGPHSRSCRCFFLTYPI